MSTAFHEYWQDFLSSDAPILQDVAYTDGYPAPVAGGRHLLLPIRVLPGDGNLAVASLILNQASFRVVDALADALVAQLLPLRVDLVIGVPTLGLPLAEAVARRLGHPRMVALSASRKFWYADELSEPLSSITSPTAAKRIYLDPRMLPLLRGRRAVLVDDVTSSGASLVSVLRLLAKVDVEPVGVAVAMTQSDRWRAALASHGPAWPDAVRTALTSPLLRRTPDGRWTPLTD